MSISFNEIPAGRRVPFVYIEFDNSNAVQGPQVQEYKALLIGQKTSAGTKPAQEDIVVSSSSQAHKWFGNGSVLARMIDKFFENNETTELHAIALDDDGSSAAASGSIAYTGTATENGTVFAYIGGEQVTVGVLNGDTAATVASNIAAKINELVQLPVEAGANSGTVNIVAKNGGTLGNGIDLRLNYNDAEETPAGLSPTVTQMSSGATDPDMSYARAAWADEDQFNIIGNSLTDTNNLDDLKAELQTRWGPLSQKDGVAIIAKDDTHANLINFGEGRNDQHLVALGVENSPTPTFELAAVLAGITAFHGQQDPARPFQTLEMKGVRPPSRSDRFSDSERDIQLKSGIATFFIGAGNVPRVERIRTTYVQNAFGADDESYSDLNTILTLSYLRFDLRNYILRKYPRHKLADDGTRYGAGQAIVTPKVMRAECIMKFTEWEEIGLVENIDQFKRDLIVQRNVSDRNRLDILLPPDLINQLRITAVKTQFIL